ncbi:MAG: phosphate--acyl-ACP acyltransferase, partial [Atopobiaceae bacterium]
GIGRPALACAMPGANGHETVMLDIGANADCRPEMIVQFARMGRAYSTILFGIAEPRVALLSNGTEDAKGSEATIAAHKALAAAGCGFVGNCEGCDLLTGEYDVIVCDGFTGNVALKTVEGTAKYLLGCVKKAAGSSKKVGVGALLLKPALLGVRGALSGDYYGGAVLLGLKAPVLVGHGATSVTAIKNGTLAAARVARGGLSARIAEACAKVG